MASGSVSAISPGFIGREKLIARIARFRDSDEGRHLVLVGPTGWGKTALVKYLAHKWNCPVYHLREGNKSGVGAAPRAMLNSLAQQLFQRYGAELFQSGPKPSLDLKTGLTAGGSEVSTRVIFRHHGPNIGPPEPIPVAVTPLVTTGHSRVETEVLVETFDPAVTVNPADLLNAALLAPLEHLSNIRPSERVLVIIDALDEAVAGDGTGDCVLQVLPPVDAKHFPKNLRLLLTSKPGNHLSRFREKDCLDLRKDPSAAEENDSDARAYIKGRLRESRWVAALARVDSPRTKKFRADLWRKSERNFLYLHLFFEAIAAFHETAARDALARGGIAPSLDLDALPLPQDLDEIYRFFAIERIRKRRSTAEWRNLFAPALGVLAVAREPLSLEQITNIVRAAGYKDVGEEDISDVTFEIATFLDMESGPAGNLICLYHRDFGDYLTNPMRNRDFRIDGAKWHASFARFYKGSCKAWSDVRWPLKEDYHLRHLADHLDAAGDSDGLLELVAGPADNNAWADEHEARAGNLANFEDDLRLAWRHAQTTMNLVQQVRCALVLASLRSRAVALPVSLLVSLVEHDIWSIDRALGSARVLPRGWLRSVARTELVSLALRKQLPLTDDELNAAVDEAAGHAVAQVRARLLANLATRVPETLLPRLRDLCDQLPEDATGEPGVPYEEPVMFPRSETLAAVALRLCRIGRIDEAMAIVPSLRGRYPAVVLAPPVLQRLTEAQANRLQTTLNDKVPSAAAALLQGILASRLQGIAGDRLCTRALDMFVASPPTAHDEAIAALSAMAPFLSNHCLLKAIELARRDYRKALDALLARAAASQPASETIALLHRENSKQDYPRYYWRSLAALLEHADSPEVRTLVQAELDAAALPQADLCDGIEALLTCLPDELLHAALAAQPKWKSVNTWWVDKALAARLARAGRFKEALSVGRKRKAEFERRLRNPTRIDDEGFAELVSAIAREITDERWKSAALEEALSSVRAVADAYEHALALRELSKLAPDAVSPAMIHACLDRVAVPTIETEEALPGLLLSIASEPALLDRFAERSRHLPALNRPNVGSRFGRTTVSPRAEKLLDVAIRSTEPTRSLLIAEAFAVVESIEGIPRLQEAKIKDYLRKRLGDALARSGQPQNNSPKEEDSVPDIEADERNLLRAANLVSEAQISPEADPVRSSKAFCNAYTAASSIRDTQLREEVLRSLAPLWHLLFVQHRRAAAPQLGSSGYAMKAVPAVSRAERPTVETPLRRLRIEILDPR